MKAEKTDRVLDLFMQEIRRRLGPHLKQVILFGSRARGDYVSGSDYDLLVVLDEVSPKTKDTIDEIAGELLYQHSVVFSVFPLSEDKHRKQTHSPFLMNVHREGVAV